MSEMVYIYLCPVCRQPVKSTMRGNIAGHLTSIRDDKCPGTGEPFHITLRVTPEFGLVTR